MPSAILPDRGVIEVAGEEAGALLDRLVTSEVDGVAPGAASFAALLTPQGKIIADFIAFKVENGTFLLDCTAACIADLVKRLTMYRLRAKVMVADAGERFAVRVGWAQTPMPGDAVAVAVDPRLPALGWRSVVRRAGIGATDGDADSYYAHRVALGVPEGGRDFAFNDAFPHEALMDQLGGVDFDKGCYVGQEVVSRMQHRGTARTRVVRLKLGEGEPPGEQADVLAGDRSLGRTGSVAGPYALATVRLDRAADALTGGQPILAGGVPVAFDKPDWVRFPYPADLAVTS